jgi:hypothetical protein
MIDILMHRTKTIMTRLEKGTYFGEVAFYTGMQRSAEAKSV